LWKDIFDFNVEWFHRPGEAEDDLANLSEQWNECDQFHRYIKSLSIRKNLRLVCDIDSRYVVLPESRLPSPSLGSGCLNSAQLLNLAS
jgi:hypothetical protein